MRVFGWAAALALLAWSGIARAEWLEASSDHFVVYAEDSAKDVRRFSEQLERYHSAMAAITGTNVGPPSPSNRVTVYVVRNEHVVRRLHGGGNRYLGGFYVPRASGSLAIVPSVTSARSGQLAYPMLILMHEYAHHFIISSRSSSLPRWLSEGSAEFFASSSFEADGGVMTGRPALHRAMELFRSRDVDVEELLDPEIYERRSGNSYDAFYGKSWLLYHYLNFEPARQGQLARYLALLAGGKPMREAGLEAFGDFPQLEKELDRYMERRNMGALKLSAGQLTVGRIAVRSLSAGEAAMMAVVTRSKIGVDEDKAKALIVEARAIAARFPGDAAVLSALAEAEYDAGDDTAAIAAADAAIALDPSQVNAYVQKGYALFRIANEADDRAAAYHRARAPFVALNKREHDHPLPLIYYYRSFVEQGVEPSPLAIAGLIRASELAPFDLGLRMTLGLALIRQGRQPEARIVLLPVAHNPHGGEAAEAAGRMIARLDKEPAWKGADIDSVLGQKATAEGEGGSAELE